MCVWRGGGCWGGRGVGVGIEVLNVKSMEINKPAKEDWARLSSPPRLCLSPRRQEPLSPTRPLKHPPSLVSLPNILPERSEHVCILVTTLFLKNSRPLTLPSLCTHILIPLQFWELGECGKKRSRASGGKRKLLSHCYAWKVSYTDGGLGAGWGNETSCYVLFCFLYKKELSNHCYPRPPRPVTAFNLQSFLKLPSCPFIIV